MSSLIPRIAIGVDSHSNKFDLSCMTHATNEIGYVMPTYSRLLVPNTKLRISTRTGIRMSPLFVPTMGQLEVRHYHCFCPLSTLWFPFENFVTGQNYTLPDGTTYLPTSAPKFTFRDLWDRIFGGQTSPLSSVDLRNEITCAIYGANGSALTLEQLLSEVNAYSFFNALHLKMLPQAIVCFDSHNVKHYVRLAYNSEEGYYFDEKTFNPEFEKHLSIPTPQACDFSDGGSVTVTPEGDQEGTTVPFVACYNFNGAVKRLRTIFMGLGYSFNPYDSTEVTPFKLFAFYKSYFTLFGTTRSQNFFNTYCYKSMKMLSDQIVTSFLTNNSIATQFLAFIMVELTRCTYTCPADYFSASDPITNRGSDGIDVTVTSPVTSSANGQSYEGFVGGSNNPQNAGVNFPAGTIEGGSIEQSGSSVALAQQIAARVLRFINKNSVVGKKISDLLRARYGVEDVHNNTHEHIIKIGASATPISISAVYNQNGDSVDMPLGAYGGIGVGADKKFRSFKLDTGENCFGVFVTLTAVVPKMGYFQGMLRENSDGVGGRYDFWHGEYDALGWQSVRYNELIADRQFVGSSGSLDGVGTNLGIFGYMPRYTHLKCSFNRAIGDISLPSKQDSMLPYTLDRYFDNHVMDSDGLPTTPSVLPVNDPQTFRSGTQGQTNRIFNDNSQTDDHIIMQIYFDIDMRAPMKSIATSFDTYDEGSTHSSEFSHQ